MNKLEVIKFLMEDTAKEIGKDAEYDKALKEAKNKAQKSEGFHYFDYMPKGLTGTNRQRIKDNLKMIRRLSLEIEKEL